MTGKIARVLAHRVGDATDFVRRAEIGGYPLLRPLRIVTPFRFDPAVDDHSGIVPECGDPDNRNDGPDHSIRVGTRRESVGRTETVRGDPLRARAQASRMIG